MAVAVSGWDELEGPGSQLLMMPLLHLPAQLHFRTMSMSLVYREPSLQMRRTWSGQRAKKVVSRTKQVR